MWFILKNMPLPKNSVWVFFACLIDALHLKEFSWSMGNFQWHAKCPHFTSPNSIYVWIYAVHVLFIENVPQYHVGTIWDDSFLILGVMCGVRMEHGNNMVGLNIMASPPWVVPFNNPQYCDIVLLTNLGCKSMRTLILCLEILHLYSCTHL